MRTKEELIKEIPFYLVDNGISVEELAKKIGVSKMSVYNWINGKNKMNDAHYIKLLRLMENYDSSNREKWNEVDELIEYMFNN